MDVKALRLRHGATQQALADALGVSLDTIKQWESGRLRVTPARAEQLAAWDAARRPPTSTPTAATSAPRQVLRLRDALALMGGNAVGHQRSDRTLLNALRRGVLPGWKVPGYRLPEWRLYDDDLIAWREKYYQPWRDPRRRRG